MNEITGALTALRATYELARIGLDARDDAKLRTSIFDMSERLSAAFAAGLAMSEKNIDLMARLHDVESELRELQGRVADRENYVLHEIAPGRFVYRFKPSAETAKERGVPTHHLCQNCLDAGKKSVLRLVTGAEWEPPVLACAENSGHAITLDR